MKELPYLEELRRRLRERERAELEVPGFRRAAVLVPLLAAPGGLELLFTVRSAGLRNHAGQIAFPGGRVDRGETVEEAALRETWEEIGVSLPPGAILGRLDDHPTPARYVATPVVAVMEWPQRFEPNPAEVSEVFAVPVADLRGVTPRWEERLLEGMTRRIHFFEWQDRLIWGFTGNVLRELLQALPADGGEGR